MPHSCESSAGPLAGRAGLPDVFPISGIQPHGHDQEETQEQQYPDAQFLAELRDGFGHPGHECAQVRDVVVELSRLGGVRGLESRVEAFVAMVTGNFFFLDGGIALRVVDSGGAFPPVGRLVSR